ncbi:unnamed protein product [Cercospora beticola]|nr:unnamed protein product [Cercospora beticola]
MPRTWPAVGLLATAALGDATLRSARLFLTEQALCRRYYARYDPAVPAPDGRVDEQHCKLDVIQAELSMILGVFEAITFLVGLLATPLTTCLAPTIGLRKVMTVNVLMMSLGALYSSIVALLPAAFDIRLIWLTGFFELIGGGTPSRNALLYIHLAEQISPDALSETLYRLSTLIILMSFAGTSLGALLLSIDVWLLCSLGVGFCALGLLIVPFLQHRAWLEDFAVSATTPLIHTAVPSVLHSAPVVEAAQPRAWKEAAVWALDSSRVEGYHSESVLSSLLQNRVTLVTMLMYMCNETAIYIRVAFPQWASKVFAWTLAEVNAVTAFQILVNGFVLLSLPLLTKWLLLPCLSSQRMVDHWVIQSSLLCNTIGLVLISIAPTRWLYIMALGLYSLGAALPDSLRSIMTSSLQDESQLQKVYTGISMVEAVAGLAGTTIWSTTFAAGLQYGGTSLAGLCFIAAAGLFALSLHMTSVLKDLTVGKSAIVVNVSEP